jgi:hypothetical protein
MNPRESISANGSRYVARCFSPRLEYPWLLPRGLKLRATPERRPPPGVFGPANPEFGLSPGENPHR